VSAETPRFVSSGRIVAPCEALDAGLGVRRIVSSGFKAGRQAEAAAVGAVDEQC
jgi:hypothetical protein